MTDKEKKQWHKFIIRYSTYIEISLENQSMFNLIEFFQLNVADQTNVNIQEVIAKYLAKTLTIYKAISEFVKEEEFEICAELKNIIDMTKYNVLDLCCYVYQDDKDAILVAKQVINSELQRQSEYFLDKQNIINPNNFEDYFDQI